MSPRWPSLSLLFDLPMRDSFESEAEPTPRLPRQPVEQETEAQTPSRSSTSLPSISSSSLPSVSSTTSRSSSNDNYLDSPRMGDRVTSLRMGKASVTPAIKRITGTTDAQSDATSIDSNLSRKSRGTPRQSPMQAAKKLFSAPSRTVSFGLDNDSSPGSSTPTTVSPSPSPRQRTVSLTGSPRAVQSHWTTELGQDTYDTVSAERQSETLGSSNSSPVDRNANLPSYHRGLRKQMYPPRVRYQVRPQLPQQVARPKSPPLVVIARDPVEFKAQSTQLLAEAPSSRRRAAIDGERPRFRF